MTDLLTLDHVVAGYGDSIVLDGVSLSIAEGDSLALLGRNGVGKTTLLLTIMGIARLHRGEIAWRGANLSGMASYRRARAGIGWVPQERFVFPSLTIDEHLSVIARPGPWTADKIYRYFPRLHDRRHHFGNQLSGGEQQMLAIARALMVNPTLLLLDEPMEGLAPIIVQDLMHAIDELRRETGLAIIIVEQHARLALRMTRHAIILDRGLVVHRSTSDDLLRDDATLVRTLAVS
ncbi:MAG TPA: ABC transporter ATP-binding protein [Stellaceae bacterium]